MTRAVGRSIDFHGRGRFVGDSVHTHGAHKRSVCCCQVAEDDVDDVTS